MSEGEIDPEALQAEVEQIKGAMGIQERYPGEFHLWLVWGALVFLASIGSQLIVLRDFPGYWQAVVWFTFMGAGGVYQWWAVSSDDSRPAESGTKPRIHVVFGAVFALYVVFVFVLAPVVDEMGQVAGSSLLLGLVVGLVGVSYLVVGESLRAYYIRRRDRWAFYVGGAWMLLLAILIPNVGVLETWGYAAFGVLYAIHALGAYVVLSR